MSEQEQADLDVLKAKIKDIKVACFDACSMYLNMEPKELGTSIESCILFQVNFAEKEISRITGKHIRKYPD